MNELVFLLEEASMKALLSELLPRIVPEDVVVRLISHEGKSDLESSIPRKLRAWLNPNARFIVVRDQDNGDCKLVKARLYALCQEAGKPSARVRIACRQLENWYLGDLQALAEAFGRPAIAALSKKAKFRNPDRIGQAYDEIKGLVPVEGKISLARAIGRVIVAERNTSPSFQALIAAVRHETALAK
jgi:hypothetical protein